MEKQYWRSLAEREDPPEFARAAEVEFSESPLQQIECGSSRRGFLKAAGFAFAGAALTSCSRAPVEKAMPYLVQPEDMVAGRTQYYASTCGACPAGCGLLAKARDGRPIKLEGNPEQAISRGATCAVGQASILGLYDSLRLKQPLEGGKASSWAEIDQAILARLDEFRRSRTAVRYLSGTITSPTKQAVIDRFLAQFHNARHVMYDALSASAILDAQQQTHGTRVLPHYRFDKADVVASFDADFLGTWISPVEFTHDYSLRRHPPEMTWHVQFESRMSLTGSKADRRVRIMPGENRARLAQLAERIAAGKGNGDEVAERLLGARGRSLVVCGANDVHAQLLVNYINHLLGNYGATVDIERPSHQRQGDDRALSSLLDEIKTGEVAALLIDGVNPVAELPDVPDFARVGLVVSFAGSLDETAERAHYICPDHHYLESWADAEPIAGLINLTQPMIRPLGATRSVIESLSAWSGQQTKAYDLLRQRYPAQWDSSVEAGFVATGAPCVPLKPFRMAPVESALAAASPQPAAGFTLALYPSVAMLEGRQAYNPWLHELPDPVTKVTWDNCASLSPAAAASLDICDGDMVRIEGGATVELPAVVQPGQHDQVIAIALGYGRKASERFAGLGPRWIDHRPTVNDKGRVGENAAPFLAFDQGLLRFDRPGIRVTKTGRRIELAATQTHHTLTMPKELGGEVRPIVQEISPAELAKPPEAAERRDELWPEDHAYKGHRWGLAVDLNACTGCSACVVACQVENNTPVVGKDEVRRRREMHWIRIDRYYWGTPEHVEVAHQPMMCQQCDHAPCETVCPTLATVHSGEGLNQQIYNRCVGTRYCANNCPYKTRRFNWFNYPREDRLANLVLNPDVTVRTRGVMEKCTFCVQRIQEAKIETKRLGAPIKDGDIRVACEQACPAGAIVFGDLNDQKSHVARLARDARQYRVLEDLNVGPAVRYLKIVRNRTGEGDKQNG
jgi:molybdopterin-containing oxidoreductase family iron-sulfur binding subunit